MSPRKRRLVWPNGAIAHLFSGEEPERLRGPNLSCFGLTNSVHARLARKNAVAMAQLALRVNGPRATAAVHRQHHAESDQLLREIVASPTTAITRSRTMDNAPNLDASTSGVSADKYETRHWAGRNSKRKFSMTSKVVMEPGDVGRMPGRPRWSLAFYVALWWPSTLLAGTSKSHAETGIVRGGYRRGRALLHLADMSGHFSPDRWAKGAIDAYHSYRGGPDRC